MKLTLDQYQKQTWVIGVSGGSDSMALLDLAYQNNIHCIVCHVNYQKRESAHRDQLLVEKYCSLHKIPILIFKAPELKGNFQDAARRFRYQKMSELAHQYHADAMVVAHHLDDDLETILFQEKRKSYVDAYGLLEVSTLYNTKILRPLLSIDKEVLVNYCIQHKVPYGEDESNLDLRYTRNRIRSQLRVFSRDDKQKLIDNKNHYNLDRLEFLNQHQAFIENSELDIKGITQEIETQLIREWLRFHKVHSQISTKFVEELLRQVHTAQRFDIQYGHKRLLMQYQRLYILPKSIHHYRYEIKDQKDKHTQYFDLEFDSNSPIKISDQDFPIIIQDASSCLDLSALNLNRWFIKHKIPLHHRELWPILKIGKDQRFLVDLKTRYNGAQVRKIRLSMVK
jgi:tRNA(Ile)-lysidine synthetase-like protein